MSRYAVYILTVILIAGLMVGGCSTTGFALSEKKEIDIGRQVDKRIKKTFGGEYVDADMQKYIETIGFKLAAVSERPQLHYHFTVLNDDGINAMAVPGGYVYITKGMLNVMQNEAQLAATLGHEIAHIAGKHGVEKFEQDRAMNLLMLIGSIVASRSSEKTAKTATQVMRGVSVAYDFAALGYGRKKELEADWKGGEYMYKIGYDPRAAVQVLNILLKEEKENPNLMFDFLRSHPKTTDRIARVNELIHNLKQDPEYDEVKDKFYPKRYLKKVWQNINYPPQR